MTTFNVRADIGSIDTTVEADTADEAIDAAIQQWDADALEILVASTFQVNKVRDET